MRYSAGGRRGEKGKCNTELNHHLNGPLDFVCPYVLLIAAATIARLDFLLSSFLQFLLPLLQIFHFIFIRSPSLSLVLARWLALAHA